MSNLATYEFELDDGHRPGKSTLVPRIVLPQKEIQFFEVFEQVLGEEWRERAYHFAIDHGRPWGAYVTRGEALDQSIDLESCYRVNPIQAIGR